MIFPSSPTPFTIAEDETAQTASRSCSPINQDNDTNSPVKDPCHLASLLAELRLDSSSSISCSRVVAVADGTERGTMMGDGKVIDLPFHGLSIEQTSDLPSFSLMYDSITLRGYYIPGDDDIVIDSCDEARLEIALYNPSTNKMGSNKQLKNHFHLTTGLWQVYEANQIQFCICVFPRLYSHHLVSRAPKRPLSEHEKEDCQPSKRARSIRTKRNMPDTRAQKFLGKATEPYLMVGTANDSFRSALRSPLRREMDTTLTVNQLSATGEIQSECTALKLRSVEPVHGQPISSSVLVGKHAKHGLVSIKLVIHPIRDSIQQLVRRWRREVLAAKQIQHPSLARVLNADARLLSLCLDGQPILFCQRDEKDCFSGTDAEGVRFCIQIASALHFLHQKMKKPHLAVNCTNILKKGDRYTLSGFGIAEDRAGSNISRDEMRLYAAPEHIFGGAYTIDNDQNGGKDGKKDVFSLAVILAYVWKIIPLPESCAGAMPRNEWLRKIERIREKKAGKTKDPKYAILLQSLNPDPEARCSSEELIQLAADNFDPNVVKTNLYDSCNEALKRSEPKSPSTREARRST